MKIDRTIVIVAALGVALAAVRAGAVAADRHAAARSAADRHAATRVADSLALLAAESALDTLAATERAFAALAVEKGMHEAFVHYLGRDGLVFRRGFVNGLKSWAQRNPPGTLDWAPGYAEVAGNADLGWTFGPWEYRPPTSDERDYGTFVTVWARPIEWIRPDERVWRVALDMGISHPRPARGVHDLTLERGPVHPPLPLARPPGVGLGVGVGVASGELGIGVATARSARDIRWREMRHAVNQLLGTDRSYGFDLGRKGAAEAIGKYAAEDLRVFRDGAEPTLGKLPAIAAGATANRNREWTPLGSRVSTSYDLGYSWGLARTRTTPPDTSAYFHIWRRDPRGEWVMIADVENRFAH